MHVYFVEMREKEERKMDGRWSIPKLRHTKNNLINNSAVNRAASNLRTLLPNPFSHRNSYPSIERVQLDAAHRRPTVVEQERHNRKGRKRLKKKNHRMTFGTSMLQTLIDHWQTWKVNSEIVERVNFQFIFGCNNTTTIMVMCVFYRCQFLRKY